MSPVRSRFFRIGCALLGAAALSLTTGCASMEVKSRFVADESCPSDRVTVRQVGLTQPSPIPPPPPEVAADPQRRATYLETRRAANAAAAGQRVFEATGCGHRRRYTCDYSDSDGQHWCEPDL